MPEELVYTSVPQGLTSGSRGFCVVEATPGISPPMVSALEMLSGYKHIAPPGDPSNPTVYRHVALTVSGKRYSVLSRIADAGLDYSERTNKLAHHLVLTPNEQPPGGPAWLLAHSGFMKTKFDGRPKPIPPRRLPTGDRGPAVCTDWDAATGDPGWAGVLAETVLGSSSRLVHLVVHPRTDLLALFLEAIALLPADRRWRATFSTIHSSLPTAATCQWRGVLAGSPEAAEASRIGNALRIDLTRPLGEAKGGDLVDVARTGRSNGRPKQVAVPRRPVEVEPEPDSYGLEEPPTRRSARGLRRPVDVEPEPGRFEYDFEDEPNRPTSRSSRSAREADVTEFDEPPRRSSRTSRAEPEPEFADFEEPPRRSSRGSRNSASTQTAAPPPVPAPPTPPRREASWPAWKMLSAVAGVVLLIALPVVGTNFFRGSGSPDTEGQLTGLPPQEGQSTKATPHKKNSPPTEAETHSETSVLPKTEVVTQPETTTVGEPNPNGPGVTRIETPPVGPSELPDGQTDTPAPAAPEQNNDGSPTAVAAVDPAKPPELPAENTGDKNRNNGAKSRNDAFKNPQFVTLEFTTRVDYMAKSHWSNTELASGGDIAVGLTELVSKSAIELIRHPDNPAAWSVNQKIGISPEPKPIAAVEVTTGKPKHLDWELKESSKLELATHALCWQIVRAGNKFYRLHNPSVTIDGKPALENSNPKPFEWRGKPPTSGSWEAYPKVQVDQIVIEFEKQKYEFRSSSENPTELRCAKLDNEVKSLCNAHRMGELKPRAAVITWKLGEPQGNNAGQIEVRWLPPDLRKLTEKELDDQFVNIVEEGLGDKWESTAIDTITNKISRVNSDIAKIGGQIDGKQRDKDKKETTPNRKQVLQGEIDDLNTLRQKRVDQIPKLKTLKDNVVPEAKKLIKKYEALCKPQIVSAKLHYVVNFSDQPLKVPLEFSAAARDGL